MYAMAPRSAWRTTAKQIFSFEALGQTLGKQDQRKKIANRKTTRKKDVIRVSHWVWDGLIIHPPFFGAALANAEQEDQTSFLLVDRMDTGYWRSWPLRRRRGARHANPHMFDRLGS